MNRTGSTPPQHLQGSAFLLVLIFIGGFAALAAALPTGAGSNLHIAANGVSFSGNTGGTIRGSVRNDASTAMERSGSNDLLFNRSGQDQVPAGCVPRIVMHYAPSSYTQAAISADSRPLEFPLRPSMREGLRAARSCSSGSRGDPFFISGDENLPYLLASVSGFHKLWTEHRSVSEAARLLVVPTGRRMPAREYGRSSYRKPRVEADS